MVEITSEIALTSVTSVATLLILVCTGIIASQYPKPTPTSERGLLSITVVRKLATLYILVIEPCLTFTSVGSHMTLDTFKGVWPMAVYGLTNPIIGLVITAATMVIANPPKKFRHVYLVNGMFANILGVPLILMQTLCTHTALQGEEDCFERATSFAFVHQFGFEIVFWTVGYALLTHVDGPVDQPKKSCGKQMLQYLSALANPPFIAIIGGFMIALVPGAASVVFGPDAPLQFLSGAAISLGGAGVPTLILLMSSGVGQNLREQGFFDWVHRKYTALRSTTSQSGEPSGKIDKQGSSISVIVANERAKRDTVDDAEDHDADFFKDEIQPHGEDHVSMILDPSSGPMEVFNYERQQSHLVVDKSEPIPYRVVIWMVLSRMIFVSIALFAFITYFGGNLLSGPDAKLAQLTLTLQSVTPATNLSILICQKTGDWKSVHALAQSILLQYILSMLTLTIFTALALGVYE